MSSAKKNGMTKEVEIRYMKMVDDEIERMRKDLEKSVSDSFAGYIVALSFQTCMVVIAVLLFLINLFALSEGEGSLWSVITVGVLASLQVVCLHFQRKNFAQFLRHFIVKIK